MSNIFIYLLLILMTIMGAFGGFFFKKSTEKIKNIKDIFICLELYIGGTLYFLSALINIYLLKFLPYTIILPMTAITYIWTLLIAQKYLKEKITFYKKLGVLFIIIGAYLITKA